MKQILIVLGFIIVVFVAALALTGNEDRGSGRLDLAPAAPMGSGVNGGVANDGINGERSRPGMENQDQTRPGIENRDGMKSGPHPAPGILPDTDRGNTGKGTELDPNNDTVRGRQ